MCLTFQAGCGYAFDNKPLEEGKEDQDRNQRHDGHSEHCSPFRRSLVIEEHPQSQRYGKQLRITDIDQLTEEIVPRPDEGEDSGGHKRRLQQRKNNAYERLNRIAAVHDRRLIQLMRNAADELNHQEDEEGIGGQELGHDQRIIRIDPIDAVKDNVLRDQGHMIRQHNRHHHGGEEDPLECEIHPCEREGRHRTSDDIAQNSEADDNERIHIKGGKADSRQADPSFGIVG